MTNKLPLNLISWYPHSGCRWLNRSLLAKHSRLHTSEFFLPWLSHSTDMTLNLDRTSQVHKSRSMPELNHEFEKVKRATDIGREAGIAAYIEMCLNQVEGTEKQFVGALSPGAPEPLNPDLKSILKVHSNTKIIHLVRHPLYCYHSMKSRAELDGDPIKIAASWVSYNALVRSFQEQLADRYFLLKYEDLKENTEHSLKELCSWLGLGFEPAMLEGLTSYHGKNKGVKPEQNFGLTKEEVNLFWDIVGKEAEHYQYNKA